MKKLLSISFLFLCFHLFAQSDPGETQKVNIAKEFLKTKINDLGFSEKDLLDLKVLKYTISKKTNSTNIYFNQLINGMEVRNATVNVHLKSDNSVFNWGNSIEPISNKDNAPMAASLNEKQAIQAAASQLGYSFKSEIIEKKDSKLKNNYRLYGNAKIFSVPDLSRVDIPVKLMYVNLDGVVVLTWELNISAINGSDWYNIYIDANNGNTVLKENWTKECNFGSHEGTHTTCEVHDLKKNNSINYVTPTSMSPLSITAVGDGSSYRVYAAPIEAPSFGARTLLADPAVASASPFGWHDTNGATGAEFTTTQGNNAHAYTDLNDDDNPDAGSSPSGGAGLDFDFPIDLTLQPSTYRPAAVTNLFYFNNYIHDFAHVYGFDESNGNFQENNYGNGGLGSDYVYAEAQDGGGTNNANFGTPNDGNNPRMQMYLWNYSSPGRDGDFDNGVIAHEYAHGISNRLVGTSVSCLDNTEQMGEGWSDFFAYASTWQAGTNLTSSRGIGTYVLNQSTSGNGIRPTKYSYDLIINPSKYNTIKTAAIPHGIGYVWASMLWDLTVKLIDKNGESQGLDIALNLVMEGLKQTTCSPGFVSGRDGILAADALLYNSANTCLIWEVFARRGLGVSASQGSTSSRSDGVEAYDVPPVPVGMAAPAVQSTCSGSPVAAITLSADVLGSTFSWTRDNTVNVTGISASGTGNISGTLTNLTNAPITVTFTIIPSKNGCNGLAYTATITVNPSPTYIATPASQNVCQGAAITTIVPSGGAPGSVYNWTRDNTANVTGIPASGSGNISGNLINSTNAPITVTFTIVPVNAECPGTNILVTVVVNPTLNITSTPVSQTICSGNSITNIQLTGLAAGSAVSWTRNNTGTVTGIAASGAGNITGTLTNTTTSPVTVTFTAHSTLNGCAGPDITTTVLVNPTPTILATPLTQNVCSQSTITPIIITGAVTGTIFNWTRNNTANVTGIAASGSGNISGTLINTTNAPITVTFTITPAANGCSGTSLLATVTVNPAPPTSISANPNPVCTGETMYLSATGGTSYSWTGPNGFTSSLQNPSRNITSVADGGLYTVAMTTIQGCNSNLSINVVVNQGPLGAISANPNPLCTGNTLNLDAPSVTFYAWTGPNGFTSTLKNPSIPDVQLVNDGTYTVVVTSSQGCVKSFSVDVEIKLSPIAKIGFDQTTACMGSELQLFANDGGSYVWTGPNGFTSTAQNPTIANASAVNSGNYNFVITAPNGCSSASSTNIVIQELPIVSALASDYEVCEGSTVSLFSSGNGVNYQWNGPYGYISNYQNPVIENIPGYMSGIYTVKSTGNTGCVNAVGLSIVVSYRIESNAFATPNPVCEGSTLELHATGGDSYIWTGPNGFHSYEQNPVIHNTSLAAAGEYAVVIHNSGGCEDAINSFDVAVTPVTSKAQASASPNPVKEYNTVQFTSSNGVSHSWTGPLNFSSDIQNPFILKITRFRAGVYTVVIENEEGCLSTAKVNLKVLHTNKNGQFIMAGGDSDPNLKTIFATETTTSDIITGNIYPNPTEDLLHFDMDAASIEFTIYNMLGQVIINNQTTFTNSINTAELNSGIYYIIYKSSENDQLFKNRFVKIK